MRQIAPWLLVGFLLAQGTGSAAEVQPVAAPTLEMEVADLNRSLQELVTLLREYLGRQQMDLLFKRIELGLQKMSPLNQEKRDLLARKAADEEELKRMQAAIAVRQAIEPQGAAQPENPDEAAQKILFEASIKRLKSRISEADQRIAELDSELLREDQNIRQWEALIDQRLSRAKAVPK